MKVYVLTDDPYHDNECLYGVFSSLAKAQMAHKTLGGSSRIVEAELDEISPNMKEYDAKNYPPSRLNISDATVEAWK